MAADKKAPAKKPAAAGPKKEKGAPVSRLYEVSGNSIKRKNKHCPKCGAGTFLSNHKDRATCGKCGYMEKHKQ